MMVAFFSELFFEILHSNFMFEMASSMRAFSKKILSFALRFWFTINFRLFEFSLTIYFTT